MVSYPTPLNNVQQLIFTSWIVNETPLRHQQEQKTTFKKQILPRLPIRNFFGGIISNINCRWMLLLAKNIFFLKNSVHTIPIHFS